MTAGVEMRRVAFIDVGISHTTMPLRMYCSVILINFLEIKYLKCSYLGSYGRNVTGFFHVLDIVLVFASLIVMIDYIYLFIYLLYL